MRIGFFGTPKLARDVLEACVIAGHEIVFVVSQPDKPIGRKSDLVPSTVSQFALSHGFTLYRPQKVRNNFELFADLKSLEIDFIVVVAYGKILPMTILDLPKYLSINVH